MQEKNMSIVSYVDRLNELIWITLKLLKLAKSNIRTARVWDILLTDDLEFHVL